MCKFAVLIRRRNDQSCCNKVELSERSQHVKFYIHVEAIEVGLNCRANCIALPLSLETCFRTGKRDDLTHKLARLEYKGAEQVRLSTIALIFAIRKLCKDELDALPGSCVASFRMTYTRRSYFYFFQKCLINECCDVLISANNLDTSFLGS